MPLRLTRRDLLKNTVVAAATGGARQLHAAGEVSPIMTALSSYMSEAGGRALPNDVTERTKFAILDTFAAMISGSELPPGRFAIQFARAYKGEKVATIAGSDVMCGPIEAALVNGMLAHSDETDDTHPPSQSHPGASAVPSAMAVGEQFGIDGTHLIRAVALGYDVGPRVTMTLGKLEYMVETHRSTHGISGIFGSAAAAGCAARLNAQQMRWMLSYTAQQASGLASWQRDTDHIEKAFDFAGMPARDGVTAALLVQAGGTGIGDIFSGDDNFLQAFKPRNDPAMLIEKLGDRYEVTRTSIKKWTVGSPIQAPLDALEILLKRNGFEPAQVREIVVRVGSDEAAIVDNREIPDICLQHMMAVMLLDKTVSFRSAHDKLRMQDPAILRERAKVRLIHDEELQRKLPNREAIVEVTLARGEHFTERVTAVRGTAENPMTKPDVIAKSRDLIAPVMGSAVCEKLIAKVFDLESVKNISEFRPLLQRL